MTVDCVKLAQIWPAQIPVSLSSQKALTQNRCSSMSHAMQTDFRSLEHLGAEKNAYTHRPYDSRRGYSFGYMIVFKILPKAGCGNTCLKSEHLTVEAETW